MKSFCIYKKNAYVVLCNPNYKNLPVTISNSCMTHSKNAWIFEDSGYPVGIIVPHLSQNWWYVTVTSFKWLPNEISLVQERTEQVKPRLLYSHGQIQKGPWTAVNKQNNFYAFSRHRHRSLGLDRHIRSIFFLPIPNKHYRTQTVWRYQLKRARMRFSVTCNIVIVMRDLEEKYFSLLVQDSVESMKMLSARVDPFRPINWC